VNGYLLDTHILLRAFAGTGSLPLHNVPLLATPEGRWVGVASLWEIAIKTTVGKLKIDSDLHEVIVATGLSILPMEVAHIAAVRKLPLLHRDPFDRMLVAQALAEGLVLPSGDPRLAAYGVRVVRNYPCSAAHIAVSRAAVQMRGVTMSCASS
jgi:PIN domain nuclease of toxin-antitoxin system